MEQSFEEIKKRASEEKGLAGGRGEEHPYAEALAGDSFEDAATALEKAEALQEFRAKTANLGFASFHEIIETATIIDGLPQSEQEDQTQKAVSLLQERVSRFSPRVADLYCAMLAEMLGEPYEPRFEITVEKIQEMSEKNDFYAIFSSNVPWDIKANRIETRLADWLKGARAFDRREGEEMNDDTRRWRQKKIQEQPTNPVARNNRSRPGVDPMERLKQGERAPAIWSIYPAWGGYYKEQSFSKWDNASNTWVEDEYAYSEAETVPLSQNNDPKQGAIDITMRAEVITGQWTSLPVPYTHGLHKIESQGRNCSVKQDQNGDLVVLIEGSGEKTGIKAFLAPNPDKRFLSQEPGKIKPPDISSEFSDETNKKLGEIAKVKQGNIARARAIKSYVVRRISYLAPKDYLEAEHYNGQYRTSPKGFAGAVDELRKGDCDVVNTYFAALCANLDIPVRHVVGHSVKGRNEEGASSIHCGTGHGWSEVWNEIQQEWIRIDATPAGDPNLEENGSSGEEPAPGDYGEQEPVCPSDEELEELREKLVRHKEELSYTREERQLAEAAGIELREAREIVGEIREAESVRLSNGELVVDALARLWDAIAESRKTELPAYTGPVRRREDGQRISHIVRHYIGIQAGETDPISRERPDTEIKEEHLLNGMDVYVIGDKSGSMKSHIDEEQLWQLQRRFEYLLFSSLYRFNLNLEKAHLPSDKDLDIRTMAISFRDNSIEAIDLDKPLSSRFTPEDKVRMWHSLGKEGGGNGDVPAIQYIYQTIKEEKEEIQQKGIEDNRLRVVIAYSDGGYAGAEAQMRAWAEEMSKLNVVVVGIGLTEAAKSVPVVMNNPPKSFGEIVSNLDELAVVTARHIILQAVKLFPEKSRENAEQFIEETLVKFGLT